MKGFIGISGCTWQQKRGKMRKKSKEEGRRSRKRLRTGGIIAALVASAAVFVVMVQIEKNILTQYERGIIYTASASIPQGQLITEENYTQYFQEKQLDKSCIPSTALSSPDQITGLVAAFPIEQGVLLTMGMFEPLNDILEEMEKPVVAGFKAEDISQVAGGVLRSGDRVNIYTVREGEANLVWSNVFVQQVFDASGSAILSADNTTAALRVNVYLDESEVEEFYSELANGSLRVVKLWR